MLHRLMAYATNRHVDCRYPEPLLEKVGNRWHTVALAGTQPANIGTSPVWDDKNREEQAVVARFISEKLVPFAQQTKISPTYTLRAGNVCHLCTDFSFQLADSRDLLRVIETLHPTPAVCGLPRSEAFTAILEDETTPRRYYAGFSGPLALHGETSLYVSLRCMQLAKGEAVLYAGGGIMPESQMETEWEETERKLQTMLNLLQCTVIPHRSTN